MRFYHVGASQMRLRHPIPQNEMASLHSSDLPTPNDTFPFFTCPIAHETPRMWFCIAQPGSIFEAIAPVVVGQSHTYLPFCMSYSVAIAHVVHEHRVVGTVPSIYLVFHVLILSISCLHIALVLARRDDRFIACHRKETTNITHLHSGIRNALGWARLDKFLASTSFNSVLSCPSYCYD